MLIQCLQCKKEILSLAEVCPECGNRDKQYIYPAGDDSEEARMREHVELQKNPVYVVLFVILLSVVAIAVYIFRKII